VAAVAREADGASRDSVLIIEAYVVTAHLLALLTPALAQSQRSTAVV
jgi:hypothetical protein